MHIVGLEGEVAPVGILQPSSLHSTNIKQNGTISKLALLQAPDPDLSQTSTPSSYTPAQKLLHTSKAYIYDHETECTVPIWLHPTSSIHTFPPSSSPPTPSFLHPDLLPHAILTWAHRHSDYKVLTRISALQIPDEYSKQSVIGMHIMKSHTAWVTTEIGEHGPVPAQLADEWAQAKEIGDLDLWNKKKPWEEEQLRHFAIDGQNGERVVEVWASRDRKTFKLVTNLGREGIFGEDAVDGKEWDVKRAEEGEVIVGLSVCFGRLGGWSQSAKMWSHWGMSDVGVVVASGEREEEESQ